MSVHLDELLNTYGSAEVIVVIKRPPPGRAAAKLSAAMAAAVPVNASKKLAATAENLMVELGQYFRQSETSHDTALATAARTLKKLKGRGLKWYRSVQTAAPKTHRTPACRYFPNLGVMLGNVDAKGRAALEKRSQVAAVLAAPSLSLIRPVAAKSATPKGNTWGIERMNVHELHRQGLTGQGVVVGHLDTGVDGKHPVFKNAFTAFAQFDDFGFEVAPAPQPFDTDDHGTHTAGTIAGRRVKKNAVGVAPGAMLASAIVIEGGNVIARLLGGMDWVIGQGVRVLNMSLGLRGFFDDFLPITRLLRERNILPVFAVGNEGPGTSRSPGNYSEALSVGAVDRGDRVADFSSSRRFARPVDPVVPDLLAPGTGVISAIPGGGFEAMDGTSMATPHIAGLVALLMEAHPDKSIDAVETAIFQSCTRITAEPTERQGRGVPDAVRALRQLGGM